MTTARAWTRRGVLAAPLLAAAGCGAGSRTPAATAALVPCDLPPGTGSMDIRVLAYNSTAIDPFTYAMVRSCSTDGVRLLHEPIDFAGQMQKTTATLAGRFGTYDIIETYGFIIPELGSTQRVRALDDLFDEAELAALDPQMRAAMSYEGRLYGLPMQAQVFTMVYRSDVFERLSLTPPTTFAELREVCAAIKDEGEVKHPLALPLLATGDVVTAYDTILGALGSDMVDAETHAALFNTDVAASAFTELLSLLPFMDPQVTTFDQPAVQQQITNGTAAIAIMFSGRMQDLAAPGSSAYAEDLAFAPPPSVDGRTKGADGQLLQYNALSVDGWSIPANIDTDPHVLAAAMRASVSEGASRSAVPAALPARRGVLQADDSPFAAAQLSALSTAPPPEPYPWSSQISVAITPHVAGVVTGRTDIAAGLAQMQQAATEILKDYR